MVIKRINFLLGGILILFIVSLVSAASSNIQSHPISQIDEFNTSFGHEINFFRAKNNICVWGNY
jgi:hypothetical protein